MRYTKYTRCIYKTYKRYKMYKMYKIYKEGMTKYKTDERYLSQYSYHNRGRSW